jgi:hypothetical protein
MEGESPDGMDPGMMDSYAEGMMGEEYGDEMSGNGGQHMDMDDEYDNNDAFNYMPPLDRMRKIRRDIMRSVNEYRSNADASFVHMDFMMNRAATEYAEYLLENEESAEKCQEFCDKNFVTGDCKPLVGLSQVEEDDAGNEAIVFAEFMDAHGLLLEL